MRLIHSKDGLPISDDNPLPVEVVGERGVILWHVADENIAKIENGEIIIIGEGETEITANVNGHDYTIILRNGGD